MKTMTRALAATAFATALATPAFAAPRLREFAGAGTGCDMQATDARLSGNTLVLSLFPMVVEAGPEIELSESRKACTMIIAITSPRQQVAIEAIDVSFDSHMAPGDIAEIGASAFIQGSGATHEFGDIRIQPEGRGTLTTKDLAWSPCGGGRALVLQLSDRISAPSGEFGTARFSPRQLRLKTRNCQ